MWFDHLINVHSAVQGIVILSLICTLGLALGKIHVKGISLGIAFVFFVGIVAGHLGLTIDEDMLEFAESFGLTMFVYVLGLYVGPAREPARYGGHSLRRHHQYSGSGCCPAGAAAAGIA